MYEKKVEDGFDVLEVEKGTWVEAIFAKVKPEAEKPRLKLMSSERDLDESDEEDEDAELPEDDYRNHDAEEEEHEEPSTFDDEDITEENYRTTFEIESDPDEEADGLDDYVEE